MSPVTFSEVAASGLDEPGEGVYLEVPAGLAGGVAEEDLDERGEGVDLKAPAGLAGGIAEEVRVEEAGSWE